MKAKLVHPLKFNDEGIIEEVSTGHLAEPTTTYFKLTRSSGVAIARIAFKNQGVVAIAVAFVCFRLFNIERASSGFGV